MTQSSQSSERKLKKVLIVIKKSSYQIALDTNDTHTLHLIEEGDETVAFYKPAHFEQEASVALIKKVLEDRGIEYQVIQRGELTGDPAGIDAVLVIGGDGTCLDASHSLVNVPMLGINPTSTSFGHYCLANRSNVAQVIDQINSGALQPLRIFRLEARINDFVIPEPVLNEISFGHLNWRETSRYLVTIRGSHEEHKSSGFFIGPASGSTGWLRSAGAPVLPVTDRKMVYRVILPWLPPGASYNLAVGVLAEGDEVVIQSKMPRADIGVDGSHVIYPVERGDKLVIRASTKDLLMYISPNANDAFMEEVKR